MGLSNYKIIFTILCLFNLPIYTGPLLNDSSQMLLFYSSTIASPFKQMPSAPYYLHLPVSWVDIVDLINSFGIFH